MSLTNLPKAILTDVFGTVVDWRTTVVNQLITKSTQPSPSASPTTRETASTSIDWSSFAQAWRHSYYTFTRTYNSKPQPDIPFRTIDQHHRSSLDTLLQERALSDLWTPAQRDEIAQIWHRLTPWDDSANGLRLLNKKFCTCTLSNGNQTLLRDLAEHGELPYAEYFSGEDFGAYKPSKLVYEGAAERLGLEREECALLAAHLADLEAAKGCGYQTIYVEREGEEEGKSVDVESVRVGALVDMWIEIGQGGLEEVARRFGILEDGRP